MKLILQTVIILKQAHNNSIYDFINTKILVINKLLIESVIIVITVLPDITIQIRNRRLLIIFILTNHLNIKKTIKKEIHINENKIE